MLASNSKAVRATVLAAALTVLVGLFAYAVDVSLLSTPKDGSPGAFVTHVFGVLNDTAVPETYALAFTAPEGWGLLGAPTSIALQPGEEGTLFVTITLPPGATAGSYVVSLEATAQSDPSDQATATGPVTVTPTTEIEILAPTGTSLSPGSRVNYEFVLVNRGNTQDSITIEASSSRGLVLSLSETAGDLAPQERLTFTIQLSAEVGTEAGRDVLTVVAESSIHDGVEADAVVFTSILPPAPSAVGGTVMEELPARIRLSIDKNVMTGLFDSQLTFSTSGQILGGYFSSFFSLLDPFGPSNAEISSFSMLYRRQPTTFSIGSVSQRLTDLLRLSCTGGSLAVDADYYDLSVIGGGSNDETRFAGYVALGPDAANVGIGYLGIRDAISVSKAIWTATAHAEPLDDWDLTLEGSLGLDGSLTSRALFFNTTINSSGYFFSGSAFSIGTHFPGQRADSAGIEVSQRLRLSAISLSASLSHEWDNVNRNPLLPTRIQDDLGFNLTATPVEDGPTLASTIDFSWDRYADLSVKSDLSTLLAVSLVETAGVFPYSVSGRVLEHIDHVLGTHVRTTTYSEGVGLSVDAFYLFVELSQDQSVDVITDTELSSSADVSIRFRPETALHEASITFRNTLDDFDLSGSFFIHVTDDFDVTFDGSISWDRHDASDISFGWGIAFNANVSIPLPFMVTKGRVEGRAFIDNDGDGFYGLNDDPAGAIVVKAGQSEVSTDADGYFRFPPAYPDSYTLTTDQLPPSAATGQPIPVTVVAGDTSWVDVPLSPVVVVTGAVFEDISRDGSRDANEGGFAQVRVLLETENGTTTRDAYTDIAGAFMFSDVLPGSYEVSVSQESLPDRFEFTTPDTVALIVSSQAPPPTEFGGFIREREVVITFQPPTADFFVLPESPVVGMPTTFDGTYSFDFDGAIVSYAWDFNDDGVTDSTEAIATMTFTEPGTFDISLTVVDDAGNEDTVIYSVTVTGGASASPLASIQPPVADFSYMPAEPQAGESILFNGSVSSDFDGSIVAYAWDFDGDGVVDAIESVSTHTYYDPGSYSASLTVTDNGGNTDRVTYAIVVTGTPQTPPDEVGPSVSTDPDSSTVAPPATPGQLPIADFQISPTQPLVGESVLFNGTSSLDLDGRIVAFAWDFDEDGDADSTAPIAERVFGNDGPVNITLTVTDDEDNSDSLTKTIVIGAAPVENSENPTAPETPAGPADPAVIPPIADFAYLPEAPQPGSIVLFNATLSADPDGTIVAYSWDFNNDGVVDSSSPIVDTSFASDGVFPVTLTVTDNEGNADVLTLDVIVGTGESAAPEPPVSVLPPIAEFGFLPTEPQTGSLVLFNGTLSSDPDGEIAAYAWDFDADGLTDSTAPIVDYAFLTAGAIDVSLTVTDNGGNVDSLTVTINVLANEPPTDSGTSLPPLADFEISPTTPAAGELVSFNGLLSADPDGEIVAYAWDFDADGITDATESFVQYAFSEPGTYDVSLTVTDSTGNTDTYIQTLIVNTGAPSSPTPPSSFQPPVADFSYMPSQPSAGELVLFNGTFSWDFDGEIVAYAWDFNGDGSTDATVAVAEHIFPATGTITVSLTVTDDSGASDTLSIPIDVQ